MSLYGFGSIDELRLFETLITVSGLGPKTAMGMLSAMSADHVAMAIASGNVEILTTIPGIGKKTGRTTDSGIERQGCGVFDFCSGR